MSHSFALAFSKGDSPMHRLYPLTMATYALCVTMIGMVGQPLLLVGIFVFTTGLAFVGKVGRQFIFMMFRVIIPIGIPLFVIQTLFNPIGHTVIYSIGPLAVKREGLDFAISVITRLLALVSAYFLLVLVVHPRDLVIALEKRGMPPKVGYLVLSTLQLIPQIQRTGVTILEAQRSRGLKTKGNLIVRFGAYLPLMGPIVMGSLSSLEIRAMALETRGFNLPNAKVYLRTRLDSGFDRNLRFLMIIATIIIIVAPFALGFFNGRS